ncbi:arylsulfatase B-like isoform X2 [Sycon ciliatum]|uniref:arylsulfatase B-like isoform X2 n=1 Tax=Sycon ciliatum TaxID=27933 RepID=UPI0031F60930
MHLLSGVYSSACQRPTRNHRTSSSLSLTTWAVLDLLFPRCRLCRTRSSIMSGKFVSHTGIQSLIHSTKPCGLPTNITTIAQQLKQLGYATHAVGKWHQGYCKPEYTPSHRGFDTFFGYYTGAEEYFTHLRSDHVDNKSWTALDFHLDTPDNYTNVFNMNGTYSAYAFTDRAINIIDNHDKTKPLYIYLPFQSVHAPLEVPPQYPAKYPKINDKNRKTFAGMVSALDEAVGNVTSAWKRNGLYENSVIVFTTDNGGLVHAGGNNYPLRGQKFTLWEGGTRGSAFVSGPLLNKTGYIYPGLVHVVDWYPTLVEVAGGDVSSLDVDGYPMWSHFSNNLTSPRTSFPYLIHNESRTFVIRVDNWKLMVGVENTTQGGWFPPPGVATPVDAALHGKDDYSSELEDTVAQQLQGDLDKKPKPQPVYLFNLEDDPTEHNDLAQSNPEQVSVMMQHLTEMLQPYTPDACAQVKDSPKSNPANFHNAYSTGWC